MNPTRRSFRRPRRALLVAAAGLIVTTSAAGAFAASGLAEHGGATRLDGDQTKTVRQAVQGGRADNVILLIGDGMGDSEITSARNYQYGADRRLPGIDSLPLTGQYTTFSLTKDGKVDYVTDSAASGTGWASGTKSYDGAIGVDIGGTPQPTLLELAKKRGLKTGDVTTAEIQDATPAVQVAHISERGCKGPQATSEDCSDEALENGGPGSISEQLLQTRPDVALGGGASYFDERAKAGDFEGVKLRNQARALGYQIVQGVKGLDGIRVADEDNPVLGLFADGNFPVNWTGPDATRDGATQPPVRCTENADKPRSQPSLDDMTKKAVALLDEGNHDKGNHKGFFLQVEGASIDKRDHAADACGQIGETIDFDAAVKSAVTFAKEDGHTLVIVSADHGHTSQIVETGQDTPGLTTTLLTADGSPMTLAYGTASAGSSQEHTGTQVRVAGYGPQAANVVGLTDQTDLFFTISRALRLGG